jgi:transcriptional regulator with XRE-family HTH domain
MMSPDIRDGVKRLRTLGERCKFARELRGLRSNQLSRLAGLNSSYVSSVEIGRRTNVEAESLEALARVLRVRVEWLLHGVEPMEGPPIARVSKPNLERCLELHQAETGRWLPHVIAAAREYDRDHTVLAWRDILDRLHEAIGPIVARRER